MTTAAHARLLDCRDAILAALSAEMGRRADAVHVADWIARERSAVANAAHDWASAHDMSCDVTVADVERVEALAVGHVDYASKLALYVAELVTG